MRVFPFPERCTYLLANGNLYQTDSLIYAGHQPDLIALFVVVGLANANCIGPEYWCQIARSQTPKSIVEEEAMVCVQLVFDSSYLGEPLMDNIRIKAINAQGAQFITE
jgi:hypothetical protein